MNCRRLLWLLSIALIAVGSVTAHTLGYLSFVGSGERDDEVAESSHGLAAHLPLVLAILVAAVAVGRSKSGARSPSHISCGKLQRASMNSSRFPNGSNA